MFGFEALVYDTTLVEALDSDPQGWSCQAGDLQEEEFAK
jgi:hypothetical protein